ncbi:MAG: terpene cyclase/mutase family protein [Fuerstiella sp.]|nr:terpene cyclase/mutase family protein [Fuerstiella sp.]
MSSASDNTALPSAEDFAAQIRARAEQAAAASVRHASLAERYLDLSCQLAALAEKVTATPVVDLRAALIKIESEMAYSTGDVALPAKDTSAAEQGVEQDFRFVNVSSCPSRTMVEEDSETSGRIDSTDIATSTNVTVSEEKATTSAVQEKKDAGTSPLFAAEQLSSKRRCSRRVRTRTIVDRVRSVQIAVARHVNVRSSKEDLKPQQRKALEELRKNRGSIVTSVTVVGLVLFILNLITLQLDIDVPVIQIMASFDDEIEKIEEPAPIEIPEKEQGEQPGWEAEDQVEEPVSEKEIAEPVEESEPDTTTETAETTQPEIGTGNELAAYDFTATDNRSAAGRQKLLKKFGGSAASESAVQRGLAWLVSVQHPQGWWDFTRVGEAGNPGRINNPIGATAYALMPFLAAGQTHRDGAYRKPVKAGLDFLSNIGVSAPAGYDLRGVLNKGDHDKEPNEAYYVHGAATLVLCEAYGMTKEKRLRRPAEAALEFLVNSQDPRGGGWRYLPRQPGSTSVTAIQVMALIAAQNAKLKVPRKTLDGVMHYLDSVQVDGEGRYGYEAEKKTYKGSLTAMALLCRMHLGWGRDDGDMRTGVKLLDKSGPYDNLYTTYFATQVMRNWGGEEWVRWNERTRDDLIAVQVSQGPGTGSWKPRTGMHTRHGGRLLETSLAILTLEVYYRYRPVLPEAQTMTQQLTDDSSSRD